MTLVPLAERLDRLDAYDQIRQLAGALRRRHGRPRR